MASGKKVWRMPKAKRPRGSAGKRYQGRLGPADAVAVAAGAGAAAVAGLLLIARGSLGRRLGAARLRLEREAQEVAAQAIALLRETEVYRLWADWDAEAPQIRHRAELSLAAVSDAHRLLDQAAGQARRLVPAARDGLAQAARRLGSARSELEQAVRTRQGVERRYGELATQCRALEGRDGTSLLASLAAYDTADLAKRERETREVLSAAVRGGHPAAMSQAAAQRAALLEELEDAAKAPARLRQLDAGREEVRRILEQGQASDQVMAEGTAQLEELAAGSRRLESERDAGRLRQGVEDLEGRLERLADSAREVLDLAGSLPGRLATARQRLRVVQEAQRDLAVAQARERRRVIPEVAQEAARSAQQAAEAIRSAQLALGRAEEALGTRDLPAAKESLIRGEAALDEAAAPLAAAFEVMASWDRLLDRAAERVAAAAEDIAALEERLRRGKIPEELAPQLAALAEQAAALAGQTGPVDPEQMLRQAEELAQRIDELGGRRARRHEGRDREEEHHHGHHRKHHHRHRRGC